MKWLPLLVATLALTGLEARAAEPIRAEPGVRYLYLIRHGDYDRDSRADDRVANGLNQLGREQATLIGKRLAKLPARPSSLVSSDYTRARETADEIGHILGMTPARDSLLHECTPNSDRTDYTRNRTPGQLALCDSNLALAWGKYARPSLDGDAHDVLVCHGNVIRWFVGRALGLEARRWATMEIGNASLTVIAVLADGTTRLATFSDVGHLPLEKQSWTGPGAGWSRTPQHR